MSKKSLWIQALLFTAFIAVFFALNLILPDKDFSEQENRYLQTRPEFSVSALVSGDYTSDFETYTTDQFTLRDLWITLKARCELLLGKGENNGVYLCKGETLIEAYDAPDSDKLDTAMGYVDALNDNLDVPVYFALIPGKSELCSSLLPSNAPNDSQTDTIDYCYANTSANTVDVLSALSAHADEYIFYRTDHHWTSRGAYYAYTALMESMGMDVRGEETYDVATVSEQFLGTTFSSSGFSWVAPDSIETWVAAPEGLHITNYPSGSPVDGMLYDFSKLEVKDKYSMFLGGNSPLQQISTGVADAPRLLIVRDSYADSLAPFLLDSFSEIDLLDLRYYKASLAQYVAENDIDMVLVCYSVTNFTSDGNLFLLGR